MGWPSKPSETNESIHAVRWTCCLGAVSQPLEERPVTCADSMFADVMLWLRDDWSSVLCLSASVCVLVWTHLTACINQMVSESQLPHKIVYSLFTITKKIADVFVGELSLWNHSIDKLCQIRSGRDGPLGALPPPWASSSAVCSRRFNVRKCHVMAIGWLIFCTVPCEYE